MKKKGEEPAAAPEQTKEWAVALRETFEKSGIDVPESAKLTSRLLWAGTPVDEMAVKVGDYLAGRDLLFRRGDEIGTIDPEDGRWRRMTVNRLRSWLVQTGGIVPIRGFNKETGAPNKSEIKVEAARGVLESDELRLRLPEIQQVNSVRLPVFREDLDAMGRPKLELLPRGYDAPSKTYTLVSDRADFDTEMEPDEAVGNFEHLLKYFEWGDDGRSKGVQLGAMLTVFCVEMFGGRSPMFLWNSNLAGAGKSRLAQLCLQLIYGEAGRSGYHYGDLQEVRKELDATAQELGPYIWFDDVLPGKIKNTDLNRWLTGTTWTGRVIQTKEKFRVPLRAATLMTGTGITMDDAIERRTLVVDIFARQPAKERVLPHDVMLLDDAFFEDAGRLADRNKILASLWGIVRMWDQCGRPEGTVRELASFEGWSRVVPGIVEAAGFKNPLLPFDAPDSGNTERAEFKDLVEILVRTHAKPADGPEMFRAEIMMQDVVRAARLNGLFVEYLRDIESLIVDLESKAGFTWPSQDLLADGNFKSEEEVHREFAAGWTDKGIESAWGKRFRSAALGGQWFGIGDEIWQFGERSRRTAKGTAFTLMMVRDARGERVVHE